MQQPTAAIRLGITASRKVGNAVARNRARRRLREVARLVLPASAAPGQDYVLVGRATTLQRPFAMLVADLDAALARLRARRPAGAVAMQEDGAQSVRWPACLVDALSDIATSSLRCFRRRAGTRPRARHMHSRR